MYPPSMCSSSYCSSRAISPPSPQNFLTASKGTICRYLSHCVGVLTLHTSFLIWYNNRKQGVGGWRGRLVCMKRGMGKRPDSAGVGGKDSRGKESTVWEQMIKQTLTLGEQSENITFTEALLPQYTY